LRQEEFIDRKNGIVAQDTVRPYNIFVKLLLETLPVSLHEQADAIRRCLEAFDAVMPLRAV